VTAPASRRYLALFLPMLAADIWRMSDEDDADALLVFTDRQANAIRLTALSRAALKAGLAPGLTLADARARIPGLRAVERDHGAEAALLARVAAGCARYTPMVESQPPDGAILDIGGCAHLFGGETALCRELSARLEQGGVTARLACGDTPEQARALARFGGTGHGLHNLPVEALEADPATTLALRRAGLKTIAALASRPRRMLAARFGDLALRLARLLGEEDKRISPERPLPPVFALRRFAEPIGRVEDALACLEELGAAAAAILLERHEGGRRFAAHFFRTDNRVVGIEIGTGRPTRDPALLARLFRERIDALADPIDPGFGFDLIRLDVGQAEPLAARQEDHLAPRREEEALDALVDRLVARLGAQRVQRVRPLERHIPECAVSPAPPSATPDWPAPPVGEPPTRPLRLFDPPQPIQVTYALPEGPPRHFTWRGQAHEVAAWEGPERIAAEWWLRRDRGGRTRDYYRVEDRQGRRFWLFRHGLQQREDTMPVWYLHGLFA
jgi:protein ImuB